MRFMTQYVRRVNGGAGGGRDGGGRVHRFTQGLTFNTSLSHFVREVTHFGSNESSDSLRVFCVCNENGSIFA